MRTLLIACLLPLFACASSAPVEAPPVSETQLSDVQPMHRVGDVYLSGQPTSTDFDIARNMGIATVVNLRRPNETPLLDERLLVEGNGMRYLMMSVGGPADLTDEFFGRMRKLLGNADSEPVLVHCASANRVGAAWLPFRHLDQGVPLPVAEAEAARIGLTSPEMLERAREYIASRSTSDD